jgi:hypothetical protein
MPGLLGIIHNKVIWASDVRFMNDTSENRHLRELLVPLLSARLDQRYDSFHLWMEAARKEDPGEAADNLFAPVTRERFEQLLQGVERAIAQFPYTEAYVTCFSEESDSLSQWQSYGSAFAIGFEPKFLLTLKGMTEEDTHDGSPAGLPFFNRVDYISAADVSNLESLLNYALWKLCAITSTAMYGVFAARSPFVKDTAFAHEKEWRLCARTPVFDLPIKFRAGRSNIIPYLEIPIDLTAIKAIKVAPGPSHQLNREALEKLRQSCGLSFLIKSSILPFRNW